jgi:hypothetical protein
MPFRIPSNPSYERGLVWDGKPQVMTESRVLAARLGS